MDEIVIFECAYCGAENEVSIDDFEGEEYCTECGELNDVEINDYDYDNDDEEYFDYDDEEEF